MKLNIAEMAGGLVLMTAGVVVSGVVSYGQSIVPGNIEVTGHLGVVSGIGSHGSFGGSVGVPLSDRIVLSGDLSYIPLGGGSVTIFGSTTKTSARAFNFNG